MKDYISIEILSYFKKKLLGVFAAITHTHTKSEITDLELQDLIATDDDNGNVELSYSSISFASSSERINALEEEVATLKTVIAENDILVANNTSS